MPCRSALCASPAEGVASVAPAAAAALRTRTCRRESGCIIAAFTAKHGQSDSLIVPWVGAVEAKGPAPFREPPESYLTIHKYGSCATIDDSLKSNGAVGDETAVVAAVKAAKE